MHAHTNSHRKNLYVMKAMYKVLTIKIINISTLYKLSLCMGVIHDKRFVHNDKDRVMIASSIFFPKFPPPPFVRSLPPFRESGHAKETCIAS